MTASGMLTVLRRRPGWSAAVGNLMALVAAHGEAARAAASDYAAVYEGRRGSMVFDVVASRQRKYLSRVRPLVAQWEANVTEPSLQTLALEPLDRTAYGLQSSEPVTMQTVAANLVDFAASLGVSEDEACRTWAREVEGLEHSPRLDPVVGAVSGIGPALFTYMRMRCGADALKPDVRVIAALRSLGFTTPGDAHSVLVVARGAASEVGLDLLSLDQLLWFYEA